MNEGQQVQDVVELMSGPERTEDVPPCCLSGKDVHDANDQDKYVSRCP